VAESLQSGSRTVDKSPTSNLEPLNLETSNPPGYGPTWQQKYHSGGYGETSLLGTSIGLLRFALDKANTDWTWLVMIVGGAALIKGLMVTADRMGRRTREQLAAEREAYRQDELRRIKEEVSV
jgi:hypothetical protein